MQAFERDIPHFPGEIRSIALPTEQDSIFLQPNIVPVLDLVNKYAAPEAKKQTRRQVINDLGALCSDSEDGNILRTFLTVTEQLRDSTFQEVNGLLQETPRTEVFRDLREQVLDKFDLNDIQNQAHIRYTRRPLASQVKHELAGETTKDRKPEVLIPELEKHHLLRTEALTLEALVIQAVLMTYEYARQPYSPYGLVDLFSSPRAVTDDDFTKRKYSRDYMTKSSDEAQFSEMLDRLTGITTWSFALYIQDFYIDCKEGNMGDYLYQVSNRLSRLQSQMHERPVLPNDMMENPGDLIGLGMRNNIDVLRGVGLVAYTLLTKELGKAPTLEQVATVLDTSLPIYNFLASQGIVDQTIIQDSLFLPDSTRRYKLAATSRINIESEYNMYDPTYFSLDLSTMKIVMKDKRLHMKEAEKYRRYPVDAGEGKKLTQRAAQFPVNGCPAAVPFQGQLLHGYPDEFRKEFAQYKSPIDYVLKLHTQSLRRLHDRLYT